jgi:hypothetical protein
MQMEMTAIYLHTISDICFEQTVRRRLRHAYR